MSLQNACIRSLIRHYIFITRSMLNVCIKSFISSLFIRHFRLKNNMSLYVCTRNLIRFIRFSQFSIDWGSYKISRNWFHFLIDSLHTSSFTTPSGLTIGQKLKSWIRYNQGCDVPARCTCYSCKLRLSVCTSSMPCPCCRRCLPRTLHAGLDLHLLVLPFSLEARRPPSNEGARKCCVGLSSGG